MAGAVNITFGALVGGFLSGVSQMSASVGAFSSQLNGSLATGFSAADRDSRLFDRGIGRLAGNLQSTGKSLTTFLTAPLLAAGTAAFKTYGDIDALQRGLNIVTGSASKGAAEFTRLRKVAELPGLGLEEAVQGSVRLQAVGFSAEKARQVLLQFGNAIALTGGGKAELNTITTQLGQLAAKGKVLAQDLKPIIEAAPSVATSIKKLFGTIDPEEISAKLQVAGKDSSYFVDILTTELSKLERVSGGPKNAIENLGDSLKIASFEFFKAADGSLGLTDKLNSLGSGISGAATGFGQLSGGAQATILTLTGIAVAIGSVLLGIGSLIKLGPVLADTFGKGFGAIKTGLSALASPIGLIGIAAVAVGGLTYSLYEFGKAADASINKAQVLASVNRDVNAAIAQEQVQLTSLLAVARNELISKQARQNAIDQINQISPQYLGNLTLETINTDAARIAIDKYTNSLVLKAKTQRLADLASQAQIAADLAASKSADDYIGVLDEVAGAARRAFSDDRSDNVRQKGLERQRTDIKKNIALAKYYQEQLIAAQTEAAQFNVITSKEGASGPEATLKRLEQAYARLNGRIIVDTKRYGAASISPLERNELASLKAQVAAAKKEVANIPIDFTSKDKSPIETLRLEVKAAKAAIQNFVTTNGVKAKIPVELQAKFDTKSAQLEAAKAATTITTDLGKSKARLKTLAAEIYSGNKMGIDTTAKQAEYKALKADIDATTSSLKTQRAAFKSEGPFGDEKSLKRLESYLESEIQVAGGKGVDEQIQQLSSVRAVLERVSALTSTTKRVEISGVAELSSKATGDRVEAIVQNVGRLRDLLPGVFSGAKSSVPLSDFQKLLPSIEFYRNEIERLKVDAGNLSLNGLEVPPKTITDISFLNAKVQEFDEGVAKAAGPLTFVQFKLGQIQEDIAKAAISNLTVPKETLESYKELSKKMRDVRNAQNEQDFRADDSEGDNNKYADKASDRIDKLKAKGVEITASVADVARQIKESRMQLFTAGADLLGGLGEGIGESLVNSQKTVGDALKSTLKGFIGIIGDYLIKQGTALALAGAFGSQAAVLAGPFGALLALPAGLQIAAGAALIAGGGVVKGIASYAKGGTFSGASVIQVGEYAGASHNKEWVTPVGMGADLISNRILKNFKSEDRLKTSMRGERRAGQAIDLSGDFRIAGSDLVLTLERATEGRLSFR